MIKSAPFSLLIYTYLMQQQYLDLAKEIADGAAEIALKYFGFDTERTWKSDNTPLTQADTEINDFVIQRITERFPDHSIQGEEASSTKQNSKYIWVCDPIDGTMPFSLGMPTFTFSLALVDQSNGRPILGLINDPILKRMYWACKGEGAFRNGERISVSKDANLKNTFMNLDGRDNNGISKIETIKAIREKGPKLMILLSFIYGGIQVANGKFSGAVFLNSFAHDVAALKIIVEEAGGKVTDLKGNERRYDTDGLGCVLSNGILHEEILRCVEQKR